MKQTLKLFRMGLRQTVNDGMLLILLPAPMLIGILVRWGIPFANDVLMGYLNVSLEPWYGLVDALMITLTPFMIALVSAFLLLDERDEGTGAYYQVTPVQGYAYLTARIGFPMVWALLYSMATGLFFGIAGLDLQSIIFAGLFGTGSGIACSMMVVALAGNRVEGLAIAKLTGVSLIGMVFVWFVPWPYQYTASFLPSFWIGVVAARGVGIVALAGGMLSCALWIFLFSNKFLRRI